MIPPPIPKKLVSISNKDTQSDTQKGIERVIILMAVSINQVSGDTISGMGGLF
jgi:hypothetical protein